MHFAKGISLTLPGRKVYLFEEYPQHVLDCLGEFRSLCQRAIGKDSILMSIENTSGFTPFEQKAIEFLLESPCFGLTLDIGHSHVCRTFVGLSNMLDSIGTKESIGRGIL